jgi:Helix-turn-helix domain
MQVKPRAHLDPASRETLAHTLAREYATASVRELADRHGLSYGRAYRLIRSTGTPMRGRGPRLRDE